MIKDFWNDWLAKRKVREAEHREQADNIYFQIAIFRCNFEMNMKTESYKSDPEEYRRMLNLADNILYLKLDVEDVLTEFNVPKSPHFGGEGKGEGDLDCLGIT